MATPTIAWSELLPADTELVSSGDDRIRELKTQIREVIAVDHKFESSSKGADWGFHKKLSFYKQTSDPAAVADAFLIYSKEVSGKAALFCKDEDGNIQQLLNAGGFTGGLTDEIRMFYGTLAQIPTGWALCDGLSGRPNLLAKFVRGINTAGTQPGTNSGGQDSKSLNYLNMPIHGHTNATTYPHNHQIYIANGGASSFKRAIKYTDGTSYGVHDFNYESGEGEHAHGSTNSGTDVVIDNRPAYYELAFIVRI